MMRKTLLLIFLIGAQQWSLFGVPQRRSDGVLSASVLQEMDSLVNCHIISMHTPADCEQALDKLELSEELVKRRLAQIPTTIELSYNEAVQKYLDDYLKHKGRSISFFLGLSQYYFPIFDVILAKHDLPLELKYLAVIESALQPSARSSSGAVGIWQMMLPTAKSLGLKINTLVDERQDPYQSTEAACLYFKKLYHIYQNWPLAIAAYNCGPGTLNRAIKRAGGKSDFWEIYPFLPPQTRHYIPAMTAVTYAMNYAGNHGIYPAQCAIALNSDTLRVSKEVSFAQISKITGVEMDEIKMLNPQYTKSIIPGHITTSTIRLPIGDTYELAAHWDSLANLGAVAAELPLSTMTQENSCVPQCYVVRSGDSLYNISRKYGTTVQMLIKSNGLSSDLLKIGQKLNLPQ